MNKKQFGFVKRFKKEVFEYLVQDNLQENSSCQGFRDLVDEDRGKALNDEKEHVLEDEKMEKTSDLTPEEDMGSTEQQQSSICVQESSTKIYIAVDSKGNILQVPDVKVQKKYLMQLEGSKWRPKTRATNKLWLNMKRILNPKLGKEKITIIEDSSSEENMDNEEDSSS